MSNQDKNSRTIKSVSIFPSHTAGESSGAGDIENFLSILENSVAFSGFRFQVSAAPLGAHRPVCYRPKLCEDGIGSKKYNRSRFLVWTVSVIDYCELGFTCPVKLFYITLRYKVENVIFNTKKIIDPSNYLTV